MLVAAAAALAVGITAGCALVRPHVEAPRVTLASVQILRLGILEQRFQLGLRVQNPNDFPVRLAGLDYRVALNGERFASGVSDTAARIPASGETVIQVPVTANLMDTAQQLLRWEDNPPDTLHYALDGHIRLADFDLRLPFEYKGGVPLRRAGEGKQ